MDIPESGDTHFHVTILTKDGTQQQRLVWKWPGVHFPPVGTHVTLPGNNFAGVTEIHLDLQSNVAHIFLEKQELPGDELLDIIRTMKDTGWVAHDRDVHGG